MRFTHLNSTLQRSLIAAFEFSLDIFQIDLTSADQDPHESGIIRTRSSHGPVQLFGVVGNRIVDEVH